MNGTELSESDYLDLERCFISRELADQAGIRRVDTVQGAEIVGWNGRGDYSGLIFPYIKPGTDYPEEYRLRRDNPELEEKDGRIKERRKYLSPPERGNRLYFVPGTPVSALGDKDTEIVITEGEKKTLALYRLAHYKSDKPRFFPIGIAGVWAWRGRVGKTNGPQGERRDVKGVIPDVDLVEWEGRKVRIVFDTNVRTNQSVRAARRELAKELKGRGAEIFFVDLPAIEGINGVDDLLVVWGPDRVLRLIERAAPTEEPFTPPEHWRLLDASSVTEWKCNPLKPIVEGMIAVGTLVIVAAPSQAGKTLLLLFLARLMVQGGYLFEKYKVHPVKKVLYLCLEDPDRRVKERLLDIDHEFPELPDPERLMIYVAPGLAISDKSMLTHVIELIDREGFEVVIIDTYQKATPGISSFDDEKQSRILHSLADLTRAYGVTIIISDHFRKSDGRRKTNTLSFDAIKGTGGKTQNSDTVILMERDGDQVKFKCQSKDWSEEIGILLKVSPQGSDQPKFTYAGELEELVRTAKKRGSENKRKVLEAMPIGEWVSLTELIAKVDIKDSATRKHLKALSDEGKVDEAGENRWRRYCRIATDSD